MKTNYFSVSGQLLGILTAAFGIAGCSTLYYETMETFGYHKRDLLVSEIEAARDSQQEAKDQFQTALEQFKQVVDFDGGDLEAKYTTLNAAYEKSATKAKRVRDHIDDVEDVAWALFDEWESELDQYSNERLRQSSKQKLDATRSRYQEFILAMRTAESKIEPVLSAFHDQVLYLKHNLNAQAIASLQSELKAVESDISLLISELEQSIAEADKFISEFEAQN